MKTALKTIIAATLIISFTLTGAYAYTLYAPDGRTREVNNYDEIADWEAVGWYRNKSDVTRTLYAPDGRTITVWLDDVNSYLSVGWYSVPVQTMYSLDGRKIIVASSEADAYNKVGWYYAPVCTMYAIDGRTIVVYKSEAEKYAANGWYYENALTMYAPDGRTAKVAFSDIDAWKKVGWYLNINDVKKTLYAPNGKTVKVWLAEVDSYIAVGWYKVPVTTLYALDGRTAVVPKTDVDAWKKVGWYDSTGYKNAKALNNFHIGQQVRQYMIVYTKFGIVRDIDYSSGKLLVYWNKIDGMDSSTAQLFYGLYNESWISASSVSPMY